MPISDRTIHVSAPNHVDFQPDLILVDGHAVVHRAFHAVGPLTTALGELVGAVYGFTAIVFKAVEEYEAPYLAVAFDLPEPTFRHVQFADYKAQRPPMDPALAAQFDRVRQVVTTLGIPIMECPGFEADDVLGTLAFQATQLNLRTMIVTGDLDALQLVSPRVRVLTPRRSTTDTTLYDEAAVFDRYGLRPNQIPDYKGLVGDTSDNIPGVKGIGDKSAATLLARFDTIENLYEHIDEVPPRQQQLLRPYRAEALAYKALATIHVHAPITLDLSACRVSDYDRAAAIALFSELEFKSLIPRLPAPTHRERPAEPENREPDYPSLFSEGLVNTSTASLSAPLAAQSLNGAVLPALTLFESAPDELAPNPPVALAPHVFVIETMPAFAELLQRLATRREWAFDLETTSVQEIGAEIVGLSFALEPGLAYYLPVGHSPDLGVQLERDMVLERLRPLLENPALSKIAHNAKYDMLVLRANYGIQVQGVDWDTMIAAYLANPTQRSFGLKDLALARLNWEMTPIGTLLGKGRNQTTFAHVPIATAAEYAGADADATLRLQRVLQPELIEKNLLDLYRTVEMALLPVLLGMEQSGVDLDVDFLHQMSGEMEEQCTQLAAAIYESVGHTFNVNSPRQLSDVLYGELGLPPGRRTSTGYSTDADQLDRLAGSHPVVDHLIDYRQLIKLKGTYVDGLPPLINPRTGRLHTSYNQTQAATGRLSSSNPNLQNIPIRTDIGRRIRRAFVVKAPTMVLLAADYSQIELRILAHLSQDAALIAAFARDDDIHVATAALMMGIAAENVTADMRRLAKTTNYGVIYGLSDFGLARSAGITRAAASAFIKTYNETYAGVAAYMEHIRQQARSQGYVATMHGRRRYLPEIASPDRTTREAAERAAINMPIQGSQADLIKIAMIEIAARLDDHRQRGGQAEMILQVHDELVFRLPTAEVSAVATMVEDVMEHAMQLSVPIRVDMRAGANWADLQPLTSRTGKP